MKPKPIVGQTLYALNVGNNARGREQSLTPVTVLSVGRKYFKVIDSKYTSPHIALEYHLDDWNQRTQYTPDWRLYESPQTWEDEKEAAQLRDEISKLFSPYGRPILPLAKLRRIHQIILEDSK